MGRAFEYRKAAKLKRWGTMSKVFPKLAKVITMAAKEGGPDPRLNPKLRTAILNAKAENMPKENIEAAIKRAVAKDSKNMFEIHYEAKAAYGVLMFIECATDNSTRTVANIKAILNKNGAEMLNNGSLEFMFSRKAVFEFALQEGMDLEELELELIDAGLEELEVEDGVVVVMGDYKSFGALHEALEQLGVEIKKATLERIANTPITLSDTQQAEIDKLLKKLDEDDDVQRVFTNLA